MIHNADGIAALKAIPTQKGLHEEKDDPHSSDHQLIFEREGKSRTKATTRQGTSF
jgi:hypothetical protein